MVQRFPLPTHWSRAVSLRPASPVLVAARYSLPAIPGVESGPTFRFRGFGPPPGTLSCLGIHAFLSPRCSRQPSATRGPLRPPFRPYAPGPKVPSIPLGAPIEYT